MTPTGMPHGYGIWAALSDPAPTIVKEPPVIVYDAPCDVCGAASSWRTVLHGSTHQETYCDCPCTPAEAAA